MKVVKDIVLFLLVGFTLTLSIYLILKEDKGRICYVNITKVFERYTGMKDKRLEYGKQQKLWKDTLDILYSRVVAMQKEQKNDEEQMTPELVEQIRILNRYKEILERRTLEVEDSTTKEIVLQLKSFSSDFAKRYNYDVVLGSDQFGTIFYSSQEIDKTELFISEVNNYYLGKSKNR